MGGPKDLIRCSSHETDGGSLVEKYLFQGFDDSNEVFILFEAKELARAKAFAESQDLRERMEEAGSEALAKASSF
jgi:hypothetical protein